MLEIFCRIFNRLNILIPFYYLINGLCRNKRIMSFEESIVFLHTKHPDLGKTCITNNYIPDEPEYDLQIIVPVYNVEKYLELCLDSIVKQKTDFKFCVTIINDGSTDGSALIINKYKNIPHIHIINQTNKGLSGARNAALKNINAKYIMFVDSDDFLLPNAIQNLLKITIDNNYDIVQGSYIKIDENNKHLKDVKIASSSRSPTLIGFPWGKIYRSSLFNNICFPENYWFEDSLNSRIIFQIAKNNISIPDFVYAYRVNSSGITQTAKRSSKIIDSVYITMQLLKDQQKLNIPFSLQDYEHFLKQIAANHIRLHSYGDKQIEKTAFAIHCNLIDRYYSEFKTNSTVLAMMEKALRNRKYLMYRIASGIV